MPGGMDGVEVLRRIRTQANGPPVVVLTAFASAENTIEAMRIGAFDHLTKPIGRQELQQKAARRPSPVITVSFKSPIKRPAQRDWLSESAQRRRG
jgi:CheY-like chemotaxis protein